MDSPFTQTWSGTTHSSRYLRFHCAGVRPGCGHAPDRRRPGGCRRCGHTTFWVMAPSGKRLRGGIALLRAAGRRSDDAKMDTDRAAPLPPPGAARSKQAALEADLSAKRSSKLRWRSHHAAADAASMAVGVAIRMGADNPRSIILAGSSGVRFNLRRRNGLLNSRRMSVNFMCRPRVRSSLNV